MHMEPAREAREDTAPGANPALYELLSTPYVLLHDWPLPQRCVDEVLPALQCAAWARRREAVMCTALRRPDWDEDEQ